MRIPRRKPLTARIGVVAVGHHTYWQQFPGLLEELMAKVTVLERKLQPHQVTVLSFGMLDRAQVSYETVPRIRAADLDLLLVDMVTYATSSTFGVLLRELNLPVVLVALQPLSAMDYARGSTYMQLCNDDLCSVPEFTGVALRLGKRIPDLVLGVLEGDPAADAELGRWCRIAHVLHDLRRARLGHMGHVLESMLDMHTDPTALTRTFGAHVVQCEAEELLAHYRTAATSDIDAKRQQILSFFTTPEPGSDPIAVRLTDQDLETAARVAVALEAFVDDRDLDGLAYYYEGEAGSELRTVVSNLIVGNSLLCAAGFPMCGEFDIKTCVAMLIMDRLEIGGSFAEFHPVDFERDSVLVGHDGPHHINIAADQPVLRSLKQYHGKPGAGASVEFRIKEGPITMLSIGVNEHGQFRFVVAEGESIRGPIPPTGNTNTHVRFRPDVRTFLQRWVAAGPTHHFALGIGHHADTLARIGSLLDVETLVIARDSQD